MQHRSNDNDLPSWFVRPEVKHTPEQDLFPENLPEALANLRISLDDFRRWLESGWVPFTNETKLQPDQVTHLRFLRDVTRSGLGDAQIASLMDELPTKSLVNPEKVAYSFTHGWVEPRHDQLPSLEDVFDEELDELVELEDWETLLDLRDRIDARVPEDEIVDNDDA